MNFITLSPIAKRLFIISNIIGTFIICFYIGFATLSDGENLVLALEVGCVIRALYFSLFGVVAIDFFERKFCIE